MTIEPSTALLNEYGTISDAREKEVLKLRAKLASAEQSRLSGQPAVSLEKSRRRLEDIYFAE